jgi:predicted benzoate:H+ symporter BenE
MERTLIPIFPVALALLAGLAILTALVWSIATAMSHRRDDRER